MINIFKKLKSKIFSKKESFTIDYSWNGPEDYIQKLIEDNFEISINNKYMDIIIFNELYLFMPSGSGLYHLFELLNETISYSEYRSIIENSSIFSVRLKELLLNEKLERAYACVNNEQNLTEEEDEILSDFEMNYSMFSDSDIEHLENEYFQYAIDLFANHLLTDIDDSNVVRAYYNKEKHKRIEIIQTLDNTFKVLVEKVEFMDSDDLRNIYQNNAYLTPSTLDIEVGIYESIESLIEDIKPYLNGYIEIKLDK